MFTPEEIARIERLLREGVAPEGIAADLGMALTSFRMKLSYSGYRVVTRRALEKIVAVEPAPQAPATATIVP